MLLPEPRTTGGVSLESAIARRRSTRSYEPGAITLEELSQLLWAAYGITDEQGFRAAPSAGATYPLEVYALVGEAMGLEPGLYHYEPSAHSLTIVKQGDLRVEISHASLDQPCVRHAAAILMLTAMYDRTTERYGERGRMYVHMDVGHAAQNVLLQATALGLGSVPVGAFRTKTLGALLDFSEAQLVMCLLPVGKLACSSGK